MRQVALYLLFLLPFYSVGQAPSKPLKLSKLVVDSKKTYNFTEGDSVLSLVVDTLVMKDRSKLIFFAKKSVNLVAHHVVIGKACEILGTDSKNNGTNFNLSANFSRIGSLFIDVSGREARTSNRQFDNGNGGNVVINYLSDGTKPQTSDKKQASFISIKNRGAGFAINPRTDVAIIMGQIGRGSGRPLGQFPNGRVYSGNVGSDGTTNIKPINSLR